MTLDFETINSNPVSAPFFKNYLTLKGISDENVFNLVNKGVNTTRFQFYSSWPTKETFTNNEVETYIHCFGLSPDDFKDAYKKHLNSLHFV